MGMAYMKKKKKKGEMHPAQKEMHKQLMQKNPKMAAPRMDKLPGKDDIRYKPAPKPQLLQPDGPFVHIEAGVPPGIPRPGQLGQPVVGAPRAAAGEETWTAAARLARQATSGFEVNLEAQGILAAKHSAGSATHSGETCAAGGAPPASWQDLHQLIDPPHEAGQCGFYQKDDGGAWCLPTAMVLGDFYAGSPLLAALLEESPVVHVSPDTRFFTSKFWVGQVGAEVNLRSYPLRVPELHLSRQEYDAGIRKIEAAFEYTGSRSAPRRIKDIMPSVRLVMMVQRPEDRMLAHFFHECYQEREGAFRYVDGELRYLPNVGEDFAARAAALQKPACTPETFHEYVEQLRKRYTADPRALMYDEYLVQRSLVDKDLALWHRFFGCNLLVVEHGAFRDAPVDTANDVLTWLGLPPHDFAAPEPIYKFFNVTSSMGAMLPESRGFLETLFQASRERAAAMIPALRDWAEPTLAVT